MIDEEQAEEALDFLRRTAKDVRDICLQARQRSHKIKWMESILVKGMDNQDVPVTLKKDYARADQQFIDTCNEDAEAHAEWVSLQERRDTARITISLYQSQIKDRL